MSKLKVNEVENLANDGSLNFMANYDVILPAGNYISGTFTIPNGRTWDDYDLIVVVGASSTTNKSLNTVFAPKEVLQLNPTDWELDISNDLNSVARVTYLSPTQFTVSVVTNRIRMIIGYRKNGVA